MLLELEMEMNPAQNLPWAAALDLLDILSPYIWSQEKTFCLRIREEKSFPLSRLTPKMWVVLAEQGRH